MKKSINDLIPGDFQFSPIWQPIDDLEDPNMEVEPFQGESFHFQEMYLIAVVFKLADGSEMEGYVRFSWGKPREIAVASNTQGFILLSGERLVESEKRHREFAQALNKNQDDIFPIEYQTKVRLYFKNLVY
jgi:hypothetical protein